MDSPPLTLLSDIGLCIVFAAAASHLARLARQPLILGYVLGGAVLGAPLGLGWVKSPESIELISEMGLLFLLFIIGLEINLRDLARMGAAMLGLGALQFAGCAALGWAAFRAFGPAWGGRFDGLYFAVATALSSTLIVVKLLHDKFEIHTTAGRLTVGVLVLQDLWAIAFMAFQPNLLDPRWGGIARSLFLGAALVAAAFLLSRYLLGPLLHAAGKSPELVLLSSVAWCFAVAGLAARAGLSREMGALIAGLSIAVFPFGADVIAKLAGVRDFFVTLFFVSLGLKAPMPTAAQAGAALLAVFFVLASRVAVVGPAARVLGRGLRNGFLTAINLAQVSEFSLVILALGAEYGHVSREMSGFILNVMILASVVSTYLIHFNHPLARALMRLSALAGVREELGESPSEGTGERRDIVLLGYFLSGPAFLEELERRAPELRGRVLVVDYNTAVREDLETRGFKWAYGDLSHPETLEHLGLSSATVILCALSDTYLKGITGRRLLGHLKRLAPEAAVVMTADDAPAAESLRAAGADHVVVPGRLAGEKLFHYLDEDGTADR
jgi:Kef-type K+ transport system membrane component KefB